MSDTETPPAAVTYKDDDLVYVDPDLRTVVGMVEFDAKGNPKPLAMKIEVVAEVEEVKPDPDPKAKKLRPRPMRRQRFYPWGTYRSMKRVYKLEGKPLKEESTNTLDQVIEKALTQPFWD